MHTIAVPEDVHLMNPATREPIMILDAATGRSTGKAQSKSFRDYAFEIWLNDQKAGMKPADLMRWSKVCDKFANIGPGDKIELEDQDYEKLMSIAREPSASYPPIVAMQCLSFFHALENAVKDAPKEAAKT